MKNWQILQLLGSTIVIVGLFIQVFVFAFIEKDANDAIETANNKKLTYIYKTLKDKSFEYHPKWEDIDKFYRGEENDDIRYYTFEEFAGIAKVVNMIFFVFGALLTLTGKGLEFRLMNVTQQ